MFHSERFVGPEMDVVTWSERGHLGQYVGDEARRRRVVGVHRHDLHRPRHGLRVGGRAAEFWVCGQDRCAVTREIDLGHDRHKAAGGVLDEIPELSLGVEPARSITCFTSSTVKKVRTTSSERPRHA